MLDCFQDLYLSQDLSFNKLVEESPFAIFPGLADGDAAEIKPAVKHLRLIAIRIAC